MLISLRHRLIDFPNLFKSDQNTPSTLKRVSACFCPVAAQSNSLVGGHSVYIVQIFCVPPLFEFCPGLLSSSENRPGLCRGVLRAIPTIGALAGAFAVFRKQDCRARCRLRFPAVAQLKCERLVSLRRRALPRCPTLALAQTFPVWRHSTFPLILVPPQLPRRRPRRLRWAALHPQRLAPPGR